MTIPQIYRINDSRPPKAFSKYTFSGFLKTEVSSTFQKKLCDGKIEESCHWAVELLISCYDSQLYEKFILLSSKLININNPRLPYLLNQRFENYINLVKNKYQNNLTEIRNNQQIRNHIAELCCIFCKSNKGKALSIKKPKDNDFQVEVFKANLCAKSDDYINNLYRGGDPNEFRIVMNEFYFELTQKNFNKCSYWLGWMIEWEKKMIKKEGFYKCGYRELKNLDNKFYTDFIWFFWEILLKEGMKLNNSCLNNQIQSLYRLFKFEYSSTKKNKRLCLLLNAVKYFTEFYNINTQIIIEYNIIIQATGNINYMYNLRKQFEKDDQKKIHEKLNQVDKLNKLNKSNQNKKEEIKKHKIKISEDSYNKLDVLNKIDSFRLNQ